MSNRALTLSSSCRDLPKDRSGVTAVEFGLILPIMAFVFVAIADLGLGVYTETRVDAAAEYGAQYAFLKGYNSADISSAVKTDLPISNLSVSSTQFCGCPSGTGVTTVSCNASCGDGAKAGSYATVSVTNAYSTLISYPGLPAKFSLAGNSTVRLQ